MVSFILRLWNLLLAADRVKQLNIVVHHFGSKLLTNLLMIPQVSSHWRSMDHSYYLNICLSG